MIIIIMDRLAIAVVACSLPVIACCVLLAAWAIAAIAISDEPFSIIGGIIVLPLAATLGIEQYRGTFRHNQKAAATSAILTFIVGGFSSLPCVLILYEIAAHGARLRWIWSFFLTTFAISFFGFLAAWLNRRWSRRLKAEAASGQVIACRSGFTLRELLLAVAVVASISGLVAHFARSVRPRYAEHVTREEAPFGLPPAAHDVSYYRGHRGTIAFEFMIDEKSFIEWVDSGIGSIESRSAGVRLLPITTPFVMRRYPAISSAVQGPESVTITDGLYYSWSKEDRAVDAAFDRTTSRAYYFAHYH